MPLFARNRLSGVRPSWHAANFFTKIDKFKKKTIPGFSLKGEEVISTPAGGFCTLFLFGILILFASHKSKTVMHRLNPIVNYVNLPDAIDDSEVVNLGASNFRFAFSLERGQGKEIKNDPAFMRWRVRHYGRKDGVLFQNMLPFHMCTAEEMD